VLITAHRPMKKTILIGIAILAAVTLWSVHAEDRKTKGPDPVWQLTYLKALPGQQDRLERFILLNWFGPDERARQKGYINGFLLLRGSPDDPTWDLVVIDIFPDSASHKLARERYRSEIMPEHKKQLVDGLDFPALGKIVAERTTSPVGGHVEAMRLGL
jgi:hypothetical protein